MSEFESRVHRGVNYKQHSKLIGGHYEKVVLETYNYKGTTWLKFRIWKETFTWTCRASSSSALIALCLSRPRIELSIELKSAIS